MSHSNLCRKIQAAVNKLPRARCIRLHGSVYMPIGTPDLLIVIEGHAIFLEVKTGKAKQRISQTRQLLRWEKAGATCGVVRSFEDAMRVVELPVEAAHWSKP
jgi:hypothetical protein